MLASLLLRDNEATNAALRERLADVRPLLLARRAAALGDVVLVAAAFAGWAPLSLTFRMLLIAVAVMSEVEIACVYRARDIAGVDRWLVGFAFAFARLIEPRDSLDRVMARMLMVGLQDEWEERDPETAATCAPLAGLATELAWSQARRPVGAGLSLDEALQRLKQGA